MHARKPLILSQQYRDACVSVSQYSYRYSSQCHCISRRFTSTETIRLIRDGEPSTTTATFTQLVSSAVSVSQYSSTNIATLS